MAVLEIGRTNRHRYCKAVLQSLVYHHNIAQLAMKERFLKPMDYRFQTFVYAVALAIMIGWLLWMGKVILLPIVSAVISVYVLLMASEALGKLPLMRQASEQFRHFVVLALFVVLLLGLALVVISTIHSLIQTAPTYQHNLENMLQSLQHVSGMERLPNWGNIRVQTVDQISIQKIITYLFASLTNFGSQVFLVIVYTSFLMAERGGFSRKLTAAMVDADKARQIQRVITDINTRISSYLSTKTVINIILALMSYVILLVMGVDFALFWAILIGLFNYIPYIGSLIGVAMPVLLSLAQSGGFQTPITLGVLLLAAQTFVGNILEPKMIGKSVNLSPFVVLVALATWGTLWGLPGAILAIPLTSIVMIVLASFSSTRPVAVMLASEISEENRLSPNDDIA